MWKNTLFAAGLLALQTVTGCGSTEATFCDKLITCEGGNDKDKSACVDAYMGQQHEANAYSCSQAWQTYITCANSLGVCQNSRLNVSGCSNEAKAKDDCIKAASNFF